MVPGGFRGAAEGDLAAFFERAAAASFSGDQVLTCNTPVGLRDSAAHLAQKAGVSTFPPASRGHPWYSAVPACWRSPSCRLATGVQVAAATKTPSVYQIGAPRP